MLCWVHLVVLGTWCHLSNMNLTMRNEEYGRRLSSINLEAVFTLLDLGADHVQDSKLVVS